MWFLNKERCMKNMLFVKGKKVNNSVLKLEWLVVSNKKRRHIEWIEYCEKRNLGKEFHVLLS